MFNFTLLATEGLEHAFKATLMSFDNEVSVLADPGWNGRDPDDVLFMEKHLSDIDLILLSHSTPEFLGGYILLCSKFPRLMSSIPVYATLAVSQLGRVSTVEFYRSRGYVGPLESAFMEVSEVDEWFDRITLVKFFQNMTAAENKLLLTAYNSGHSLGGAFWLLTKRMEKVIYAPTWNHSKDAFLNSATFLSPTTGNPYPSLLRPTALITSSDIGSSMSHRKRCEKFLQLVDATLANGGAVVLPTNISGRFLEILRIIDEHLSHLQGGAIPVYFLSYSGTKVLSYASNLLDWMSSQLIKEYEGVVVEETAYSRLPFEPSKVDLLLDPRELIKLPGPKIVFASGLDLRDGDLSSQALQLLCQDVKTTLILTEKISFALRDSNAASLFGEWYKLASAKNGGVAEDGIAVPLEKSIPLSNWTREEPLGEQELAAFKDKIAHIRRAKLLEKVRDKKAQNILNADDDSSSSEEEDEASDLELEAEGDQTTTAPSSSGQQLPTQAAFNSHEVFVTDYIMESLESNKPIDIKVTFKMKPKQTMFPFSANSKKRKFDDYGEIIDMKDFQQTDENSANNKLISESKKRFELNDKGKWGEGDEGGRRGYKYNDRGKASKANKLTPQEALNNQLLQKNLDTLYEPVKRVSLASNQRKSELRIRCGLSFVDLAGLVDLRSMNMIVSALRPHNLILLPDYTYSSVYDETINGRTLVEGAFNKLKENFKIKTAQQTVSTVSKFDFLMSSRRGFGKGLTNEMSVKLAENNEPLLIGDLSAGKLSEFEVRLDEVLDMSLAWQKLGKNYRVAQVRGELGLYESPASLSSETSLTTATQFLLKPMLAANYEQIENDTTEEATSGQAIGGPALAIGTIRLPELKKKLLSLNLSAEFKGEGTLVVNNQIAIRKISTDDSHDDDGGDIVIDGQPGPLYYEVKRCVRDMLAFV